MSMVLGNHPPFPIGLALTVWGNQGVNGLGKSSTVRAEWLASMVWGNHPPFWAEWIGVNGLGKSSTVWGVNGLGNIHRFGRRVARRQRFGETIHRLGCQRFGKHPPFWAE